MRGHIIAAARKNVMIPRWVRKKDGHTTTSCGDIHKSFHTHESQAEAWYEYEYDRDEEDGIEYTEHERGKHEDKDSAKDGINHEEPV